MLVAGIDVGSRSAQCVILQDGQILTYSNIETGPDSVKTAYEAFKAAIHRREEFWGTYQMELPNVETDRLKIEEMDYIVGTGYGRVIVPFAQANITEISCHARGASWFVPGVRTILDMGGQDCKGIRVDERGRLTNFVMSDKCAAGTGRFLEIIADLLNLPLEQIGEVSLTSKQKIPFNPNMCGVKAKSEILFLKQTGVPKADILAGLHEVIAIRVMGMLNRIEVEEKFVMTGGPAKNVGLVAKLEGMAGLKAHIPPEPMIAGALGAALFAAEKAC